MIAPSAAPGTMKKTILYAIETSGPGGAEKMLINLVESLDKDAFRPLICLLARGWLFDRLRTLGHEPLVIPLGHTPDIGWLRRAASMLRAENVRLMHAHEFYMNTYCATLSRLTGVPCVTTVHGKNYYTDTWYRRALYRMASRHSTMIAVSDGIRHFLSERVGVSDRRLTTIRNGIDIATFASTPNAKSAARQALGLSQHQPIIGCLGNLYPVKGHTHLVQAAAAICRRYPDAVFLFAGRGKMLDTLRQQATELEIIGNVRFLGFRDDTPALLAAMDIFVLPSLSEGLPLSLLEAMAANTPVVASRVGGIPEVISHEQNGLLVEPADANALAQHILRLLDNPTLASTLAARAKTDVTAHYSVSTMTARYQALYESLTRQ